MIWYLSIYDNLRCWHYLNIYNNLSCDAGTTGNKVMKLRCSRIEFAALILYEVVAGPRDVPIIIIGLYNKYDWHVLKNLLSKLQSYFSGANELSVVCNTVSPYPV